MAGEHNRFVTIDVAAAALDVTKARAYRLSKKHKWRTALGQYPKQYSFADIHTTYEQRKATT